MSLTQNGIMRVSRHCPLLKMESFELAYILKIWYHARSMYNRGSDRTSTKIETPVRLSEGLTCDVTIMHKITSDNS